MTGLSLVRSLPILLALVLVPRSSVGKAREDPAEIFAGVAPSVVVVLVNTPEGEVQGSGVVVDSRFVATNAHVVGDSGSRFVTIMQDGRKWDARIESIDTRSDLALLQVLLPPGGVFSLPPLAMRDPFASRVGERLYAIGAPRGLEKTISDGLLSKHIDSGDIDIIQTTAPISPGSSGGALVDSSGKLVGITTLMLTDSQNLNFAVSALQLKRFLAADRVEFVPGRAPPSSPAQNDELRDQLGRCTAQLVAGKVSRISDFDSVVIDATSLGPLGPVAGLSSEYIASQFIWKLKNRGIWAYPTLGDAQKAKKRKPLVVTIRLSSLAIEESPMYSWSFSMVGQENLLSLDLDLQTIYLFHHETNGYAGADAITDQIIGVINKSADLLASAMQTP